MTRRAILDALAAEIAESGAIGFSIQDVADRAGVTHRTVYNHFPTRSALNDALGAHVEDVLAEVVDAHPEVGVPLAKIPSIAAETFGVFEQREDYVRASVMLMIASRAPAKVTRDRTALFERMVERDLGKLPPGTARMIGAALRMFVSSTGWHVMTEHLGLSTAEAGAVTTWVGKKLLAAAKRGDFPATGDGS